MGKGLVSINFGLNSLRPSDAYMHHQLRPSLAQIMACCLLAAKPLSEPMMNYCQLAPKEQTSVKFHLKFKLFHSKKRIWKCCLKNVSHFVLASICWITVQSTETPDHTLRLHLLCSDLSIRYYHCCRSVLFRESKMCLGCTVQFVCKSTKIKNQ